MFFPSIVLLLFLLCLHHGQVAYAAKKKTKKAERPAYKQPNKPKRKKISIPSLPLSHFTSIKAPLKKAPKLKKMPPKPVR